MRLLCASNCSSFRRCGDAWSWPAQTLNVQGGVLYNARVNNVICDLLSPFFLNHLPRTSKSFQFLVDGKLTMAASKLNHFMAGETRS